MKFAQLEKLLPPNFTSPNTKNIILGCAGAVRIKDEFVEYYGFLFTVILAVPVIKKRS